MFDTILNTDLCFYKNLALMICFNYSITVDILIQCAPQKIIIFKIIIFKDVRHKWDQTHYCQKKRTKLRSSKIIFIDGCAQIFRETFI